MRNLFFYGLAILLLSTGCFKDEQSVPRKERGGLVTASVELGSTYRGAVYFNLLSGSNVTTLDKFSWDIAFSGRTDEPFIALNTAKSMAASITDKVQLMEVKDTIGFFDSRRFDYPSGFSDSLALTGILKNKKVFIIDLGYNENSLKEGILLLKAEVANGKYYIEFSNLNGSNYHFDSIGMDNTTGRIFYNFKTGHITPEPVINSWDLLFTQYMHIYYDPFQTYSVTGCLINTEHIAAGAYTGSKTFTEVSAADTINCSLSSRRDAIGFDWKYFDLQKNQYYINDKKCYFIRHKSGKYYKLHFIDFYDKTGVRGTPVFEYKEL